MNSTHSPALVGVTGLLGSITLEKVNTAIAVCVGVATLVYLIIKIIKELK